LTLALQNSFTRPCQTCESCLQRQP
jgi:hypothetical protein